MSDFGDWTEPVASKDHQCIWCGGLIPKGEKHHLYKGMYDGEWQNNRWHDECNEDYHASQSPYYDEFTPYEADKPERVKELERQLKINTTNS
jgi:predicted  nucleic acid-binding Zn-ribbon protein